MADVGVKVTGYSVAILRRGEESPRELVKAVSLETAAECVRVLLACSDPDILLVQVTPSRL